MATTQRYLLNPRKMPRQARSAATVEAIHEATIQVLLTEGPSRLTTTKVAERAGVAVGTMYQYFPQKQALIFAVVQRHLGLIAEAVEDACGRLQGQTIAVMSDGLAASYLAAKTHNIEASRALYAAASELEVPDIAGDMSRRIYAALRALLASSRDGRFDDLDTVTFILQQALSGTVRAVLEMEGGPTPAALDMLGSQLPLLCRAYLDATSSLTGIGALPQPVACTTCA